MNKRNTLFFITITLAFTSSIEGLHAEPYDPGVSLLTEHLSRVRLAETRDEDDLVLYSDLTAFLSDLVAKLRSEAGFCESETKAGASDKKLGSCFRREFSELSRRAHAAGSIDEVTRASLNELTSYFISEKSEFKIAVPDPKDPNAFERFLNHFKRKRLPKGKVGLPGLLGYIQLKNLFSFRRAELSSTKNLSPGLLEKMAKLYPRRIKGVGRANPEEYMLSKYSRPQVYVLSDLMQKTVAYRSSNEGKAVLAIKGYKEEFTKIDELEGEITNAVNSVAEKSGDYLDPSIFSSVQAEIDGKRKKILEIRSRITPLVQEEIIRKSSLEIQALQDQLVRTVCEEDRDALYWKIETSKKAIKDAQALIDSEYVSMVLSQDSVRNLSMNWLHLHLADERRVGLLRGTDPTFGDVVSAALLTGEVRAELIEAILDLDVFKEPKNLQLKQWGSVAFSIVKTLSYLNPYTAAAMTVGSVIFDSLKNQKAYAKEQAKGNELIH